MILSQRTSSTHVPSKREVISDHEFEYHRHRLKTRIYEAVLQAFAERHRKDGFNRADLAAIIRRDPSTITRLLKGPGNWTIDTISDILRAIGAELQTDVKFYHEKPKSNRFHEMVPPEIQRNPKPWIRGLQIVDGGTSCDSTTNNYNVVSLFSENNSR